MEQKKHFIADKETLDKVYNILAVEQVWGFIEHNAILAPGERIEYIGMSKNYSPIQVTMGGGYTLKDWANFPWLMANKPYMVRSDGTPDYRLDESNYTKKEDGANSDVANTAYDGGAFSWAMKIYKWERMVGDDRYVLFSLAPRDGYEPMGFIDPDGNELEGAWIPMFYGSIVSGKMRSLSGLQPDYGKTTEAQKTVIDAVGNRAFFFGGSLVNTLIDLEIMFAKTTDLQTAYGHGNYDGYDASLTPTMGVKQNAVVDGGQFFGTDDGKSLNKIFHSIVLGSYQQWTRDPYQLEVNGRIKVSPNYKYDLTGATYQDTGIQIPDDAEGWDTSNNKMTYPAYYRTVPGFGHLPAGSMDGGSSSTGGCDGLWRKNPTVTHTGVSLRFGNCADGLACGGRFLSFQGAAAHVGWSINSALLLLPPVGVAA